MTHPQAPATQVVEADENWNVLSREVASSRGYTTVLESFYHGAVRFFKVQASRIGRL